MERIGGRLDVQPPTLDGILSIRGVVDVADAEADEAVARRPRRAQFSPASTRALADLVAMRTREGAAIGGVLAAAPRRDRTPGRAPPRRRRRAQPETIRARLAEQIAAAPRRRARRSIPTACTRRPCCLPPRPTSARRSTGSIAHVAAARELLAEGGPVGRRLDFLAQEFNREVNTLCAKSNDRALTAIGLEMKAVVDQFREQIQNLE